MIKVKTLAGVEREREREREYKKFHNLQILSAFFLQKTDN